MKRKRVIEKVYIDLTNFYEVEIKTGVENVSIDLYYALLHFYDVQCVRYKDGDYTPFDLDFQSSKNHDIRESKLNFLSLLREIFVFLLPRKIKYLLGVAKYYSPMMRLKSQLNKFQIPTSSKLFVPEIPLNRSHQKVIQSLCQSNIKVIFFVHDLIPLAKDSFAAAEITFAFKSYLKATRNAARIYVPSKEVKKDLAEFYLSLRGDLSDCSPDILISPPRRRARIEPTPECVRLINDGGTLVYVSSFLKRKNQIMAIKAVSEFSNRTKTPLQLLLVGSNGNMRNILLVLAKKYQSKNFNTVLLQNINECCLTSIYRSSTAALYLSLAEGYGMPIQDAMQEGLPVIASRVPAIDDGTTYSGISVVNARDLGEIQVAIENSLKGRRQIVSISGIQPSLFWPSLNDI